MKGLTIIDCIQCFQGIKQEGLLEWKSKIIMNQMTRKEANHRYACIEKTIKLLKDIDSKKGVQGKLVM